MKCNCTRHHYQESDKGLANIVNFYIYIGILYIHVTCTHSLIEVAHMHPVIFQHNVIATLDINILVSNCKLIPASLQSLHEL